MPYFRVVLHGSGIRVPDVSGGEPIIGFATTRSVRAASEAEAEEKARAMVLRDWTIGSYAAANEGETPILAVESVYTSSLFEHLRFKNTGHSFYAVSDANAA